MAQVRRAAAERDRAAWKSVLGAAMRTLLAAAISAGLSLAAWEAWQWATASRTFAVREIRFTGLVHASEADLVQRSGLKLGDNLFRADLRAPPGRWRGIPGSRRCGSTGAFRARWWRASSSTGRRRWSSSARSTSSTTRAACSSAPPPKTRWISPSSPGCRARPGRSASPRRSSGSSARCTCSTPGGPRASPSQPSPRFASTRTAVSPSSRTTGRPSRKCALARARCSLKLQRLAQVRAALARRGERAAPNRSGQPGAPRPGRRHPGRQEVARPWRSRSGRDRRRARHRHDEDLRHRRARSPRRHRHHRHRHPPVAAACARAWSSTSTPRWPRSSRRSRRPS